MQHTTNEPVAKITLYPLVQLVDLAGDPVPDCERFTPTCPPDLDDAAEWPESNDVDGWRWEPTELDPDDLSDEQVDAMFADLEPDAPDWDPAIAFPGRRPLAERAGRRVPPVSGGSPDEDLSPAFTPSAADWDDYRSWSEALDARRDQLGDVAAWCGAID